MSERDSGDSGCVVFVSLVVIILVTVWIISVKSGRMQNELRDLQRRVGQLESEGRR